MLDLSRRPKILHGCREIAFFRLAYFCATCMVCVMSQITKHGLTQRKADLITHPI